jgi:hypothetical protein
MESLLWHPTTAGEIRDLPRKSEKNPIVFKKFLENAAFFITDQSSGAPPSAWAGVQFAQL